MKKKLLATLLVLMMVVSIVPLTASAAECTEHNFVDAQTYYGWANYTTHVCTICGLEEAHIDANSDCICDACGFSIRHTDADLDCICDVCGGEDHDFVLLSDENGHWYGCSNCGQKSDYAFYGAHTDTEARVYTRVWEYFITSWGWMPYVESEDTPDGICDVCGYGCNHTKTAVATNDGDSIEYCVSCGTILTTTTTCTEHSFVPSDEQFDPELTHGYHVCTICQEQEPHIDENSDGVCDKCNWLIEHTDLDLDCICDICGAEVHHSTLLSDETGHWVGCAICGTQLDVFGEHYDRGAYTYTYTCVWLSDSEWRWDYSTTYTEGADGICDECGYGCNHTKTAVATNDVESIEYCVSCGTILTTTTTCTEHTFTSDGEDTHTCTTCGYSEDHIDADEDCICDACGYVMSTATTGNTTTTDPNLDDVPQTGDSSLILVGMALLIAAVPVVKKFVF